MGLSLSSCSFNEKKVKKLLTYYNIGAIILYVTSMVSESSIEFSN
jgi:hypothetical protein